MKLLRFIICFITICTLSISLFAAGMFVVTSFPKLSGSISYVSSNTSSSPFTREQLSYVAEATHNYAFGEHNKNSLYEAIESINNEAKTAYASTSRTAISSAPDAYTLDTRAISHLDDCYIVANTARTALIVIAGIALLGLLLTGIIAKQRNMGRVLLISGFFVIAGFIGLAIWAAVDFDTLFALFHSLLFTSGTWTFSANSLLICMFPENFWMTMAGIWAAASMLLSVICLLIGGRCTKKARMRERYASKQHLYASYQANSPQAYQPYDSQTME